MKTNQNWVEQIENGIITEEMLWAVTYSVSKRAKNCRDKQREYLDGKYKKHYYYRHDYIGVYKNKKFYYYDMKEDFLSLLKPCEVHIVHHDDTNYTEYFLFYRTAYGSFHQPVELSDISGIQFTTHHPKRRTYSDRKYLPDYTPRRSSYFRELHNFQTTGADINNLVSAQFARKVHNLVLSGGFQYIPATQAA